jgi:uncharacterized protein (DUF849 family)
MSGRKEGSDMHPLIITAAITGGGNVPSMTPYLPITTEQIADSAVAAAEAGAAIVHIHAREPETGRPSNEGDHFAPILRSIKQRCDAVVSITTPGGPDVPVESRAANIGRFRPEMAAFVPGSSNYSLYDRMDFIREYRHEWEKPFLEASRDFIYKNSFADCEVICGLLREHDVRSELEIFGLAPLYNLAELADRGLIGPPLHVEFVMGLLGAVRAEAEDLIFLKDKAERLFGPENLTWSVSGMVGRGPFHLMPLAIQMGGHIRVGIEDNVHLYGDVLAESNAQVVERYVRLAAELGRPVATPADVRRILKLKGKEATAY